MSIFKRRQEFDDEENDFVEPSQPRRLRDLKPENKKKRKEPLTPWGKKERLLILILFLATILTSGILAANARGWKLPHFNFFREETIVIGDKSEASQKAIKTQTFFNEKTKSLSGVWALYVLRLEDASSYGVREDEIMQAASLIKLPLMAAVYIEAEAGNLDMDEVPKGQKRSYRELVWAMGHSSDNGAFRIVRAALGDEKIKEVIAELGMKYTSIDENRTTPQEIGLFFQKLWNSNLVRVDARDEMLDALTDTTYENWLAAGISEVPVAHKYGREVNVVNDAGIVSSKSPFVLVIMTEDVIEKEADKAIPELAAGIYEIEK